VNQSVLQEPSARALDIESVASWAYQSELPKRGASVLREMGMTIEYRPPASYPKVSPMFKVAQLGSIIDFDREPGFPEREGVAHPDAIRVADAIASMKEGVKDFPFRTLHLADGIEGLLDPDPEKRDELIAKAWRHSARAVTTLIIAKAKLGSRPDAIDRPTFQREEINGQPRYVRDAVRKVYKWNEEKGIDKPTLEQTFQEPSRPYSSGGKGAVRMFKAGTYVPLKWSPDPRIILAERADYAAWRIGMDLLYHELDGQLESFDLQPCTAPRKPWLGEAAAPAKPKFGLIVHEDLAAIEKRREEREWGIAHRMFALDKAREARRRAKRQVNKALDEMAASDAA
jgi:hypothetical protein